MLSASTYGDAHMPTNTITIPTHELLTVDIPNACQMLGIGRTKLHEMMASGEVRAIRIAGRTLIDVASLRAMVNAAEPWKPAGPMARNHTDQAAA